MIELQPPFYIARKKRVFLAGSIEMGAAAEWQKTVLRQLAEFDIIVCNPRRDDWDPSWQQTIECAPFTEQVNWELDHIEQSEIVFFYFDPNTKSPITLMELGFCMGINHNCVIVCPPGFWRRGNIEVMCERYGYQLHDSLIGGIAALKEEITSD